ncbi:MAG: class I SAM-dependent methyltransferase family protein [Candidatus Diapherotrites archaeon]
MASFKEQMTKKMEHTLSPAEQEKLPSGFQRLGNIAIIQLKPELLEKKELIGEAALATIHGIKTICLKTGKIEGENRLPKIEYVCGENNTIVEHHEHGCIFRFDATKLMWSKGNMSERKRMYENVKKGETVVDFFCGMGYWSIPIAKHSQPMKVYAMDKNPDAIEAIRTNQKLNHIPENTLHIMQGDCVELASTLGKIADRVIMGYIPAPRFALPAAFHVLKNNGGIIHYEGVCHAGEEEKLFQDVRETGIQYGYACTLLHTQQVKSFGPKKWHYTLDIQAKRF